MTTVEKLFSSNVSVHVHTTHCSANQFTDTLG